MDNALQLLQLDTIKLFAGSAILLAVIVVVFALVLLQVARGMSRDRAQANEALTEAGRTNERAMKTIENMREDANRKDDKYVALLDKLGGTIERVNAGIDATSKAMAGIVEALGSAETATRDVSKRIDDTQKVQVQLADLLQGVAGGVQHVGADVTSASSVIQQIKALLEQSLASVNASEWQRLIATVDRIEELLKSRDALVLAALQPVAALGAPAVSEPPQPVPSAPPAPTETKQEDKEPVP